MNGGTLPTLEAIFQPVRPPSADLQRAYRAARERGDRAEFWRLWDEWFRARCEEGNPPDALQRDSRDPTERFWARVVEGRDGHWFWDGKVEKGRPVTRGFGKSHTVNAQRFSWMLRNGRIANRIDVWSTCGLAWCLNPEHLDAGWQPRNVHIYTDEALIGALQTCAMQLGTVPINPNRYEAWRPKGRRFPTDTILLRRLGGTWKDVLRQAGLS